MALQGSATPGRSLHRGGPLAPGAVGPWAGMGWEVLQTLRALPPSHDKRHVREDVCGREGVKVSVKPV